MSKPCHCSRRKRFRTRSCRAGGADILDVYASSNSELEKLVAGLKTAEALLGDR